MHIHDKRTLLEQELSPLTHAFSWKRTFIMHFFSRYVWSVTKESIVCDDDRNSHEFIEDVLAPNLHYAVIPLVQQWTPDHYDDEDVDHDSDCGVNSHDGGGAADDDDLKCVLLTTQKMS